MAGQACARCCSTPPARRCQGPLRAFFERLVGRGKPGKVALTAVTRKLLTIVNAVARDTLRPKVAEASA